MKRLFILIPAFFLLFNASAAAAEYTYDFGLYSYKITTAAINASIIVTNKSTVANGGSVVAVYKTYDPGNGSLSDKVFSEQFTFPSNSVGATKNFFIQDLHPNTTYYVDTDKSFKTESYTFNTSENITTTPLTFELSGNTMVASAGVDISKHPYPEGLTARLDYSPKGTFTNDMTQTPPETMVAISHTGPTVMATGVNPQGGYYFILPNIDPVPYWYRLSFYTSNPITRIGSPTFGKFNGKDGFSPTTVAEEQQDFEDRSYRLLAPLPGLSVLLDPDLCREQQIENPGKGYTCSINDVLNYFFRLLIGVSAIILVIRIIIEGFQYATSDVLKVKISAREKLWQGVWGLLLALTAWLILNTINPKLVENEIDIPTVSLAFEEEPYSTTVSQDPTAVPTGSVARCTVGVQSVATAGGTITVCKSIAANIKKMIDAAWAQGIKLSGGGFRTAAQQIELRRKHCGAANIYVKGAPCNPPTAYPGYSNHESGLAVDLMCKGVTIGSRDNKCFLWLQKNAKQYGLINFSKEPWHWSVDGR